MITDTCTTSLKWINHITLFICVMLVGLGWFNRWSVLLTLSVVVLVIVLAGIISMISYLVAAMHTCIDINSQNNYQITILISKVSRLEKQLGSKESDEESTS